MNKTDNKFYMQRKCTGQLQSLMRVVWPAIFVAGLAVHAAWAINNGLGRVPAMGYSTWNDCSSFRDNGPNGRCWNAEAHVRNVTLYLISSGLARLGYTQVNVDEGWLLGRYPNGTIFEDLSKFPSGMKALGTWIRSQATYPGSPDTMRYGLYSCRGTCQCGTGTYSGPGSHGYEAQDTAWMVAAGAQYLKIDSCCGSQDHATAFSDYAKWRDAMNATGVPVYFSLCGWEEWYSPPDPSLNYTGGASLGNSWRIAGDGSGWAPLTNCMNTQAAAAPYAGPGGWPDPDLLIGPEVYVGGQTDTQARAQFTLWSIFPTNLLISQDVTIWSDYALETYSNAELIAVNQDPLGAAARRIAGGDLTYPCHSSSGALAIVEAVPCDSADASQLWSYDASSGLITSQAYAGVLDDVQCAKADGSPVAVYPSDHGGGTCGGVNQQWSWQADGSVVNKYTGTCLDVYDFTGPLVDVWACNGGVNQNFTLGPSGRIRTQDSGTGHPVLCLATRSAASACSNVWGRVLANGDWVLGFVNNDVDAPAANITCDASCFATLFGNATVPASLKVRDLWAHADIGTIAAPFTFTSEVQGDGFATAYRLTPI